MTPRRLSPWLVWLPLFLALGSGLKAMLDFSARLAVDEWQINELWKRAHR